MNPNATYTCTVENKFHDKKQSATITNAEVQASPVTAELARNV